MIILIIIVVVVMMVIVVIGLVIALFVEWLKKQPCAIVQPMTNNLHGGYHDLDSTLSITAFASLDAFWTQNVSPTSSSASCYCAAYNVFILEGDLWLTQIMANTFFSLYWFFLHYFATLPAVWQLLQVSAFYCHIIESFNRQ